MSNNSEAEGHESPRSLVRLSFCIVQIKKDENLSSNLHYHINNQDDASEYVINKERAFERQTEKEIST